jgi:hypothetical protein
MAIPVFRRADLPNAFARSEYLKGQTAARKGVEDGNDYWYRNRSAAFPSLTSGKAVESKEYWLMGFYDTKQGRQNPAKASQVLKRGVWVSAKVMITKAGKVLAKDIKSLTSTKKRKPAKRKAARRPAKRKTARRR